jgi:hypothetical protein
MSRGLGKAQRLVLDALRTHQHQADFYHRWLSAYEIAHFRDCGGKLELDAMRGFSRKRTRWRCKICGGPHEISLAEIESLRRAIRTLAEAGLVEAEHYSALCARLPLTAKEKEREDKEVAAMQRQVNALANLVRGRQKADRRRYSKA